MLDTPPVGTFVPWRIAWYVAGDSAECIENFMFLMDSFFFHRVEQSQKDVDVHVYQPGKQTLNADFFEELSHKSYEFHGADEEAPLKFFEAQPVTSKRVLTITIQPSSGTHVSIMIGGSTWAFRDALSEAGVSGGYIDEEGGKEQKRRYFRCIKDLDVTEKKRRGELQGIVDNVFNNQAVLCRIDPAPEEGSEVEEWISELKEVYNMHFD